MFDVDLLTQVSHTVFLNDLKNFIWGTKVLAALIFLVASAQKYLTAFAKTGNAADKADGITPYDIVRTLIILVLIGFIPNLLQLVDDILNGLLGLFVGDIGGHIPTTLDALKFNVPEISPDDSTQTATLKTLLMIKEMFMPSGIVSILGYIGYGLDIFVFIIYLGRRFFALGVIKILSPILLAISIFPKYRDLTYNVGKVYVRTFLTIIPLLLVNVFVNEAYHRFYQYMSNDHTTLMVFASNTIETLVFLAAVWLKFKLYKHSSEIMRALWP